MADINKISSVKVVLASPEDIRSWSHGEVKKPETINYRTFKPERDGLFCERIFGPVKDYECSCGHYKKPRYKGIVCERCGVEVTKSEVRRYRMGHIELAAPVAHIWFVKVRPIIARLLDLKTSVVNDIISFTKYIILDVDEERRAQDLPGLEKALHDELKRIDEEKEREIAIEEEEIQKEIQKLDEAIEAVESKTEKAKIKARKKNLLKERQQRVAEIRAEAEREKDRLREAFERFKNLKPGELFDESTYDIYSELKETFGDYFRSGTGAEAIKYMLKKLNLEEEAEKLKREIAESKSLNIAKQVKRLEIINGFLKSGTKPEYMILDVLPVLPPDLRPMVQLDGGRFGTSDLNDLYRRVINRNNRLKRLVELRAPELILNNEKRMLQEAVNALFDNTKALRPITDGNGRPLKSLSDILKGKQGRFRQNLLGKRVDYSGRSVIVVGPELKLHQCGLPKIMALELFKPFVLRRLVELGHAQNIKQARKLVDAEKPVVWDALEDVIADKTVLLNRAPTLHRLSIQAFEPKLIEGKAIQIHPLVCPPFNADFDGDQMAVHLPLSQKAQAEARLLMLSTNNILSPAHGKPLSAPSQDIILGVFYLTAESENPEEEKGANKYFNSFEDALYAYEVGEISVRAPIEVRLFNHGYNGERVRTTIGRIIFNNALPDDWPFENREFTKNDLHALIANLIRKYSNAKVAEVLDAIKELGFKYATKPGITIGIDDMVIPKEKWEIIQRAEEEDKRQRLNYQLGMISQKELDENRISIWNKAVDEVTNKMVESFNKFNPLYIMAYSGARGNIKQIYQLAGMRGLFQNPKGEYIKHPITSNIREGLSVLEYFISTHGARKGIVDTALRTAKAGYLTRQFVDVSHDIIITQEDCGTTLGRKMYTFEIETGERKANRWIVGRVASKPIVHPETGEVIVEMNDYIDEEKAEAIWAAGIQEIEVRSPFYCFADHGICQKCYGWALAERKPVEIGEAVGIIAAQSIGEPGTQLVMRTFHVGGAGGKDITHGLPKVEGLSRGKLGSIKESVGARLHLKIEKGETVEYILPENVKFTTKHCDRVEKGQILVSRPAEVELKADFDGVVSIKEVPAKKVIRIRNKETKARYELSDVEIKVANGEFIEAGTVLAVSGKNKIVADVSGFVEIDDINPRTILTLKADSKKITYVLPGSTDIRLMVADGQEVMRDDLLAEFMSESVVSDFDGTAEIEEIGGRTVILFKGYDGTEESYEISGKAELKIDSGSVERGTVIAEIDKDKIEADISGTAEIREADGRKIIVITSEDGKEEVKYELPSDVELRIKPGDFVAAGERLISKPKKVVITAKADGDVETYNVSGKKIIRVRRKGEDIRATYELPKGAKLRKGYKSGRFVNKAEAVAEIDTESVIADIDGVLSVTEVPERTIIRIKSDRKQVEHFVYGGLNLKVSEGAAVKKGKTVAEAGGRKIAADFDGTVEIDVVPARKILKILGRHINVRYELPGAVELTKRDGDEVFKNERLVKIAAEKLEVAAGFEGYLKVEGIDKLRMEPYPTVEVISIRGRFTELKYRLLGAVDLEVRREDRATNGEVASVEVVDAFLRPKVSWVEKIGARKVVVLTDKKGNEIRYKLPMSSETLISEGQAKKGEVIARLDPELVKADYDGIVEVHEDKHTLRIDIINDDGESTTYILPADVKLAVAPESGVFKGDVLVDTEQGDIEVKAPAEVNVKVEKVDPAYFIVVKRKDRLHRFEIPKDTELRTETVSKMEKVAAPLSTTKPEAREFLKYRGIEETLLHMIKENQSVYTTEGAHIDDKHFEIIIRQMLKRVIVLDPGDSDFLPGQYVDRIRFINENLNLKKKGLKPAKGEIALLGIMDAARKTDSWLSAASFQETTRVLAEAAIKGAVDYLRGLKENVIIGKCIPAGTGFPSNANIEPRILHTKEELEFLKRAEEIREKYQIKEKGAETLELDALKSIGEDSADIEVSDN